MYPVPVSITVEVAENGYMVRVNGNEPRSMVFTSASELTGLLEESAAKYKKDLEDHKKFQEERKQVAAGKQTTTAVRQ